MTNIWYFLAFLVSILIICGGFVWFIWWQTKKFFDAHDNHLQLINKMANDNKDMSKNMTDRVMSFTKDAFERFKDMEEVSIPGSLKDIPDSDEGIGDEADKKANVVKPL